MGPKLKARYLDTLMLRLSVADVFPFPKRTTKINQLKARARTVHSTTWIKELAHTKDAMGHRCLRVPTTLKTAVTIPRSTSVGQKMYHCSAVNSRNSRRLRSYPALLPMAWMRL